MVEFEILEARAQTARSLVPYHAWSLPDGSEWTAFYRVASGFLLRFPDLADYIISADGRHVTCTPALDVSLATAEHLYLNQVLPLVLSKLGKLVFHASAIDAGGFAVAFLAESGRGKSTLAASFAMQGKRFLTDDGLVVERSSTGFEALPSHPSIRLWDDSHERLLEPDAIRAPALDFTTKARFLAGDQLTHCDQTRPLRAAYFLGEGVADQTMFRRMAPTEAMVEWTKHSFLLDVEDQDLIGAHFDHIAALANTLPAFHLDYPRRYEDLPALRAAILDHANQRVSADECLCPANARQRLESPPPSHGPHRRQ